MSPPSRTPSDPTQAQREDLGEQLRQARLSAGLTQEQVALQIGLDRASLVRLERGQVDPHLSTVLRVANALGIRVVLHP